MKKYILYTCIFNDQKQLSIAIHFWPVGTHMRHLGYVNSETVNTNAFCGKSSVKCASANHPDFLEHVKGNRQCILVTR